MRCWIIQWPTACTKMNGQQPRAAKFPGNDPLHAACSHPMSRGGRFDRRQAPGRATVPRRDYLVDFHRRHAFNQPLSRLLEGCLHDELACSFF